MFTDESGNATSAPVVYGGPTTLSASGIFANAQLVIDVQIGGVWSTVWQTSAPATVNLNLNGAGNNFRGRIINGGNDGQSITLVQAQ